MEKNIFIFDYNKCVGCHACVVACMNENGFQSPDLWRNIHDSNPNHKPDLPLFYLSLACNHCDDAPCLKNCPAKAYSRDEKTGAIIHHPEKCIGCQYCTWACPYDAPKFNPKEGIIEKCTFCNHRIEENLKPACANLCPTGALDFVKMEFTKEESLESSPVPVKVGSSLKIEKLRNTKGPEIDSELFADQDKSYLPKHSKPKITAQKEWPLLIFTLVCTFAVSIYSAMEVEKFNSIYKISFIGSGVLGFFLSTLHLGKKLRAWRSVLHIKSSWLSREIVLFSLFYVLVFIDFYVVSMPKLVPIIIGALLLFSIDMLYMLATWKWKIKIHSANTILIFLTLVSILSGLKLAFVFLISFRLTIYIYRKYRLGNKNLLLSIIRITLAITSVYLSFTMPEITYALIPFTLGELTDRIEFYKELKVPEPKIEISK